MLIRDCNSCYYLPLCCIIVDSILLRCGPNTFSQGFGYVCTVFYPSTDETGQCGQRN